VLFYVSDEVVCNALFKRSRLDGFDGCEAACQV
jgi:hypothetical protein